MTRPQLRQVTDLGAARVARAPGAGQARRSIAHPHSPTLQAYFNTVDRLGRPDFTLRFDDIVFAAAIGAALVVFIIPNYEFSSDAMEELSTVELFIMTMVCAPGWIAILVAWELSTSKVALPYLSNDMPVGNNAPTTTGRGGEGGDYGQARRSIPHPLSQIPQAFFDTMDRLHRLVSTSRVGDVVSAAAIGAALVFLIILFGEFGVELLFMGASITIYEGGVAGWIAILVALELYMSRVARPYLGNDMPVGNNAPTTTRRGGEGGDYGQARHSIPHPHSPTLQAYFNTVHRLSRPDFTLRFDDFVFAAAIVAALVFLIIPLSAFSGRAMEPPSTVELFIMTMGCAPGWIAILVHWELYMSKVALPHPHSQMPQAVFDTMDRLHRLVSTLRVGDVVSAVAIGAALVFLIILFGEFGVELLFMVALLTKSMGGVAGWIAILITLELYMSKVARPYLGNDMPVGNNAPTTTGRGGEGGDYGQARCSIPHPLSQIPQAVFGTMDRLHWLVSTSRFGVVASAVFIAPALVVLIITPLTSNFESPILVELCAWYDDETAGLAAFAVALELYTSKVGLPYLSNDVPVGNNAPTATRRGGEEGDYSAKLTEEFAKLSGPKKFSYEELMIMTNSFADDRILGRGGFGIVYEGHVRDACTRVAVKIINPDSHQGIKEYISEVKSLSQLRHKNLVQLIGYCHEANKFVLVYEFIGGGSLEDHLFKGRPSLTWERRYNIAMGLASALHYLQEQFHQCVIHRDIKSGNIMLDEKFVAKLGDFGLARLVDHTKEPNTTELIGTPGYMAPECYQTGKASKESDIYSFGVILLEIACGRRVSDSELAEQGLGLVQWVWKRYGCRGCSWRWRRNFLHAVDKRLGKDFDEKQAEALMIAGLWCAHPIASSRPSIEEAMSVLNLKAVPPKLPSKMPSYNI